MKKDRRTFWRRRKRQEATSNRGVFDFEEYPESLRQLALRYMLSKLTALQLLYAIRVVLAYGGVHHISIPKGQDSLWTAVAGNQPGLSIWEGRSAMLGRKTDPNWTRQGYRQYWRFTKVKAVLQKFWKEVRSGDRESEKRKISLASRMSQSDATRLDLPSS